MPYRIGGKGTNGCKGYPVVKEGGEVVGCHPSRAKADAHLQALYANVPDAEKSAVAGANPSFTVDPRYPGVGIKRPSQGRGQAPMSGSIKPKYGRKPKRVRRGRHSDSRDIAEGSINSGGPGGTLGV